MPRACAKITARQRQSFARRKFDLPQRPACAGIPVRTHRRSQETGVQSAAGCPSHAIARPPAGPGGATCPSSSLRLTVGVNVCWFYQETNLSTRRARFAADETASSSWAFPDALGLCEKVTRGPMSNPHEAPLCGADSPSGPGQGPPRGPQAQSRLAEIWQRYSLC